MSYPAQYPNSRTLSRSLSKRDLAAGDRTRAQLSQQSDLTLDAIEAQGEQMAAQVRALGHAARIAMFEVGTVTAAEVTLCQMHPHAQHRYQGIAEVYAMTVTEVLASGLRRPR